MTETTITDAPLVRSPFHAGTTVQFAWDSTSLGWFKECPRKYYYSMIEGYRGRGDQNVHLRFGIHYHACLEHYDHLIAQGADHDTAVRGMVRKALEDTWDRPDDEYPDRNGPWLSDHNLKTRETLIRSLVWYVEQFGLEDPAHTVILANGKPAVELSFRLQAGEDLILCGHLDRVVEFLGSRYVMDRKTSTSTVGDYWFDQFEPDNQMTLYTAASQIIYETPVKGVIIDACQIAVGFSRFSRGFTYRTADQIEEWMDHTRFWTAQANTLSDLSDRRRDRGDDPAEAFPLNDKSCHKYGGCPFRKVCSRDRRVRQEFLKADFKIEKWNPLIPRGE